MGTLSIEDCMCPICMCIFVEPVTMPCTHTLCMPCFKKNVEEASLTCPMCRTRISVWARRASKNRKLINEKLWIDIQSLFPDKVKKRIDGDDEEGVEVFMHPIINIAQPGEIRKEYEEQLQRLAEQREKEQQKEFEASEALIRKLQEEEEIANRMRKKEQIAIEKLDKEFAKELVNNEGESPVTIEALSRTRISRSASSCSSVSATSSRPASTIDTFLSKMREAEKLKEKDRGCLSPYPYSCVSPKDKDFTHKSENSNNSPALKDRCSSVISVSSSDTDVNERTLDYGYIGIDAELKKKTGEQSKGNTNKNKTETVGNPETLGTPSRSSSTTSVSAGNDNAKNVSQTRSSSTQSNDSISQELIHFRPIKLCPLTPPKKLASGKVVDPPLIRTTPKNLNKTSFGSPERSLSDIDASSPIMQRRLSELSEERKEMVEKLSKSTGTSEGEVKPRNLRISSFEEVKKRKENSENCTKSDKTVSTSSGVENQINNRRSLNQSPGESKIPLKRLIIPLEANLHEEDEFDIMTPLVEINNINKTRSPSGQTGKLSLKDKNDNNINKLKGKATVTNVIRKKGNNKSNLTSKKESGSEMSSPQRSIIDYLRGDFSCGDCESTSKIIKETNKTLSYGRDEVDGTVGSSKNVSKCGDGGSVSKESDKVNSTVRINTRQYSPTRKSKRKFDPDFVWTELSEKKKLKDKMKVCDSELDSYNSEGEDIMDTSSDISSFSKDEDVMHKKHQAEVHTRNLDSFVKKTKRVLSDTDRNKSTSRAPKRRKIENQLVEDKNQKRKTLKTSKHKRKVKNNNKVKSKKMEDEKTVQNFFSTLSNTSKRTNDSDVVDQEYLDHQLALKLEKQFQIEAKRGYSALRFKGTEGQYNFRSKPKYISS